MKFLIGIGIVLQFLTVAAVCQEKPADRALHWYAPVPLSKGAHLAAQSIERDAPRLQWTPSVVHLRGDVVIRIRLDGALRGEAGPKGTALPAYMILHAEQADYHEDTGAIDARGNVRVTFEPAK